MSDTSLYIHIGLHKTGTSSIQHSLHASRVALRRHGILYPYLGINHSHRIYSAFCDDPGQYHMNLRRGIHGSELDAFNERTRLLLAGAIRSRNYGKVILSGEDISNLTLAELHRFREFVASRGIAFPRIIIYLRNPASWLNSKVQQEVKTGEPVPELSTELPSLTYKTVISRCIEVFGAEHITYRHFDTVRDGERGLMDDFLDVVECKDLSTEVVAIQNNASLPDPAVRILDRYNRLYPLFVGPPEKRQLNPERPKPRLPQRWLRDMRGPPFMLDPALVREFIRLHHDAIEWTATTTGIPLDRHGPDDGAAENQSEGQYERLAQLLHELIHHHSQHKRTAVRQTARAMLDLQGPDWTFGDTIARHTDQ